MPSSFIDITTLKLPKGTTLADEEFNIPRRIDMLIGSDLYPYLIKDGRLARITQLFKKLILVGFSLVVYRRKELIDPQRCSYATSHPWTLSYKDSGNKKKLLHQCVLRKKRR
jgi:hypothetical protein